MSEICPVCGLPKDICVCEEVAKEQQQIVIKVVKRRYGKDVTVIEGIDGNQINLNELAKFLKTKLACGGTVKKDVIELQGNHVSRVKELLIKKGFNPNQIKA
jgi:translation initiation factor 1